MFINITHSFKFKIHGFIWNFDQKKKHKIELTHVVQT
jgi:hypothetical protein